MKLLTHQIENNRRSAVDAICLVLNSEKSFVNTEHPSFWEHSYYLRGRGAKGRLPQDEAADDDGNDDRCASPDGNSAQAPQLSKRLRNVAGGNKFSGVVKA